MNEYVTIAVNRNLSNCENSPKKSFSGLQRDAGIQMNEYVTIAVNRNLSTAALTQRPRVRIPLKPRKTFFRAIFAIA